MYVAQYGYLTFIFTFDVAVMTVLFDLGNDVS